MRLFLILLFLLIIPLALAIEINTTSYTINFFWASGSIFGYNTSEYNITGGLGETIIDNASTTTYNTQFGLFYIASANTSTGDTTDPTIAFVDLTTNATNLSQDWIFVNITASDDNLDTITIYLYNSTGEQANATTSTSSPFSVNFTVLIEGNYTINATANDTSNNIASTASRRITLDTTAPVINVTSPTNITYTTSSISINFSATDNVGTHTLFYGDGTTNTTYTNSTTISLDNADYTYTFYANDSAGNLNFTEVNFTVDVEAGISGMFRGQVITFQEIKDIVKEGVIEEIRRIDKKRLLFFVLVLGIVYIIVISFPRKKEEKKEE